MLTAEQIQDNQEIQDSLLIPLRPPVTKSRCTCGRCRMLDNMAAAGLEQPGGQYGPDEVAQLSGKVSTRLQRAI